jgi:(2R)-3-sulfolactate dehydrogenase (NADP+)
VEALIEMMLEDDDVRLPGYRRESLARTAQQEGVEIPDALIAQLSGRD